MKMDVELKQDVQAELEFEPGVRVEDIGVSVKDGVVTLNGAVGSYAEKLAATRATKRLAGVKGIADEIVVKLAASDRRDDSDIATTAVNALRWITTVPEDAVKITVRNGYLTLEGTVDGCHQKNAADEAVRNLAGVKGVINLIRIRPGLAPKEVKAAIEAALERHALLDARQIQVETSGGTVTLRGTVRSFVEKEEAERAAWAAAGVTQVDNRIVLSI
jgi:osmotically-inducible protein OsmY